MKNISLLLLCATMSQPSLAIDFNDIKLKLGEFLECRHWDKAGLIKFKETRGKYSDKNGRSIAIEGLPISIFGLETVDGVKYKQSTIDTGGFYVEYQFPQAVNVFGSDVQKMNTWLSEGAAGHNVMLDIEARNLVPLIKKEMRVNLTLDEFNHYSKEEKNGDYIVKISVWPATGTNNRFKSIISCSYE